MGMIMPMSMQEEMDRQVEHILNFKGTIKMRRVINQDRVSGAKLLLKDYFAPKHILSQMIHDFVTVFACGDHYFVHCGGCGGT